MTLSSRSASCIFASSSEISCFNAPTCRSKAQRQHSATWLRKAYKRAAQQLLWAADAVVKDHQEWQLSGQQPEPAWMDASTVVRQQRDIAEVSAKARCLSQQNSMCPPEAVASIVTAISARSLMVARQHQHCGKSKARG